jgi:hypothetical protein
MISAFPHCQLIANRPSIRWSPSLRHMRKPSLSIGMILQLRYSLLIGHQSSTRLGGSQSAYLKTSLIWISFRHPPLLDQTVNLLKDGRQHHHQPWLRIRFHRLLIRSLKKMMICKKHLS